MRVSEMTEGDDDLDVRRHGRRGVHGVARQPRRDHRAARDQGRPRGLPVGPRVDGQRIHAHLRGAAADGRRAGRQVRAQADVPCRTCAVHGGLGAGGERAEHRGAHRGARPAGRRRRRRDAAQPDDPLGRRAAGPPRPRSRRLERHRRPRRRPWPCRRRRRRRRALLAVDLLAQRAHRHRPAARRVLAPEREQGLEQRSRPAGSRPDQRRPARHRLGSHPWQRRRLDEPRRRRARSPAASAWSRPSSSGSCAAARRWCPCASSASAPSRPPT